MKYRSHWGGFKESMDTVVEINSLAELRAHLYTEYRGTIAEIEITPYGIDSKNGWNTYMVRSKTDKDYTFQVEGFLDGKLEN